MQIIKTETNKFIKPETEASKPETQNNKFFIWGWRWNKNEKRWGTMLTGHWFTSYDWVDEKELNS